MRPNYCPQCGGALPEGPHGAQGFEDTVANEGGWDCYCAACSWSGDIMPDAEDYGMYPKEGSSCQLGG